MTVLTTACPDCAARIELDLSCLLLAVVRGDEVPGRLAYICPACREFVAIPVSLATVTTLLAAGCPGMTVDDRISNPEHAPGGPPLTVDDLIDLYAALSTDDWLAAVPGEQS
jgi:hypothetical protein